MPEPVGDTPTVLTAESPHQWRTVRGGAGWAILLIAMILSGICWAISSPVGSSPDDDFHLASIYCPPPPESSGCKVREIPVTVNGKATTELAVEAPGGTPGPPCFAFHPDKNGDCTTTLPDPNVPVLTTRVDKGSYPPLYYNLAHLLTSPDVVSTTIRIRIMNVILFAALMIALGLLAPPATRRLMAFVLPIASVPLGVFFIASINPSSWTFTGVLTGWLALHIFLQTERRRTQIVAVLVGVIGTTMALGSRADGGPYLAVAAIALTLLHYRTILAARWKILVAVALAIAGSFGLLLGRQSSIFTAGAPDAVAASGRGGGLFHNLLEFPQLINGMFGRWAVGALGWLDTPMPGVTYVGIATAVGGLLLIGLRSMAWHKAVGQLLVFGTMIVLPLRVLTTHGMTVGNFVQPRYLLPLLPLLIGVTLIGTNPRITAQFRRGQVLVLYVLVTIANLGALYANIRRYVTGTNDLTFNLNSTTGWWWSSGPSPMTTWILGSIAFAATAAPMLIAGWQRTTSPAAPAPIPLGSDPVASSAAVVETGHAPDVRGAETDWASTVRMPTVARVDVK